jgi:ABC-2 type transport system permease protein/lipopolysaccharide transport system permease protein
VNEIVRSPVVPVSDAAGTCERRAVYFDAEPPAAPLPTWRYRRRYRAWALARAAWGSRALIWTLAEREIRVRYKQAVLGFAWAVVTPLILMAAFTVFFSRAAKLDTGPIPYPLFAFVGLIPWAFFSTSVAQGGLSLIANVPLLNKVSCPREVFPLASVSVAGLDSLISIGVLGLLFVWFGFSPPATIVWVPLILAVQVAFTIGVTLLVAAVVVYLRDLRHALPLMLQLGLFVTPVAFPLDVVPAQYRMLYVALNPLGAVIDAYRRVVLLGRPPVLELLGVAGVVAVVVLVGGYSMFKRLETGIADVA